MFHREATDQQALDAPVAGDATAEQARGKDARVIDDEQIARTKEPRQIRHGRVCYRAAVPAEMEEPGSRAFACRLLRDQLGRQIEVEIANVHSLNSQLSSLKSQVSTLNFQVSKVAAAES